MTISGIVAQVNGKMEIYSSQQLKAINTTQIMKVWEADEEKIHNTVIDPSGQLNKTLKIEKLILKGKKYSLLKMSDTREHR